MKPIPLIRANLVSPFASFLRRAGVPLAPGLRQAKLPTLLFDEPNEFVAAHRGFGFVDVMARREAIDQLGLLVASDAGIGAFGDLGPVLVRSPTLYRALQTLCRESHRIQHQPFSLAPAGDEVWIGQALSVPVGAAGFLQVELYTVGALAALVQSFAGPQWRPTHVSLMTEGIPGCTDTAQLSESRLRVRQKAVGITVPRSLLSLPPRTTGRGAGRSVSRESARPSLPPPAPDFAGSLQQALTAYLREGSPDVELAAELGMHQRTHAAATVGQSGGLLPGAGRPGPL